SLLLAELPTIVAPERPENDPLLPNIRTIIWKLSTGTANLHRVLLFIPPSLKSLTLDLPASAREEGDSVRQLFDGLMASPELDLETFKFTKPEVGARMVERLSSFLERQPNLKVLVISTDPYLEPRVSQERLFPTLPSGLRELRADVEFHDKTEYIARIQTISQRLPNLRVLKLVLSSIGSWDLSNFESLSPFLQNRNLEELTLYISTAIHLDTRDIHALGKALPRITRLDLRLHYNVWPALKIQASSLMDFAKAFPNLRVLTTDISSTDISCTDIPLASLEGNESAEPEAPKFLNLRVLNVGTSSLSEDDVVRMAEFLAKVCADPLLEIEYDGKKNDSGDSVRPWRDVEAMVELIRRPNLGGGNSNADRTPGS
ncbi:hypothetical protein FRC01_000652, partial [Tulasnella sp. 417]